jgi:hypothetical protein
MQGEYEAHTFYDLAGPLASETAQPVIPYGMEASAGWAGDFNSDMVADPVFFHGFSYENTWSNALYLALSKRSVTK